MTTVTANHARRKPWLSLKRIIGSVVVIAILVAMGLDTTVVTTGSATATGEQFSQAAFGQAKFPEIQQAVTNEAVPAVELAAAINKDKQAAVAKYAVAKGAMPVMAVKFTGVIGAGQLGTFEVAIGGVPENMKITVQTGPAIIGTALRDSDPAIDFGDFTNQIDYQNAAAGINNAMKKAVLAHIDRDNLAGQTVTVVGAFTLVNPKAWRVTPVQFSVQQ